MERAVRVVATCSVYLSGQHEQASPVPFEEGGRGTCTPSVFHANMLPGTTGGATVITIYDGLEKPYTKYLFIFTNNLSLRQVRGEAGGVKRALALIRDHADILRLNEKDAAPEGRLDVRCRQFL